MSSRCLGALSLVLHMLRASTHSPSPQNMCTHSCTHMHIHTHVCRETQCAGTCVHIGTRAHTHTHVCIHIRAHLHTPTCRHEHTCTEMHTQARTHTHAPLCRLSPVGVDPLRGPHGHPAQGSSSCELPTSASRAASCAMGESSARQQPCRHCDVDTPPEHRYCNHDLAEGTLSACGNFAKCFFFSTSTENPVGLQTM